MRRSFTGISAASNSSGNGEHIHQQRHFLTRVVNKAVQTLSTTLSRSLLEREKHMVTEPRRPLEVRKSTEADLNTRLKDQRKRRQILVPEELRVFKAGQMLELRWPIHINDDLNVMRAAHHKLLCSQLTAAHSQLVASSAAEAEEEGHEPTPVPDLVLPPAPEVLTSSSVVRTRVLAEMMRAQSPSTDVVGANHLVYGKRGLTITDAVPMGQYGVRLVFSDEHSGGIFPYDFLFELGGGLSSGEKFRIMRHYVKTLRDKRKSRDPPVAQIRRAQGRKVV
jgi:DUF971 family protein